MKLSDYLKKKELKWVAWDTGIFYTKLVRYKNGETVPPEHLKQLSKYFNKEFEK